jgi:hydroxylaminobenzene mutase
MMTSHRSHRLLQLGILLFLFGLLTGFAIPVLANPRMGLSSHLEGVLNGMFLLALGLIWPRLRLGRGAAATTYWLAIYGTFANWAATLLAAAWGAGRTMPIAAGAHQGTATQETVIMALLFSLSLAVIAVCGLVLWGLRGAPVAEGSEGADPGPPGEVL